MASIEQNQNRIHFTGIYQWAYNLTTTVSMHSEGLSEANSSEFFDHPDDNQTRSVAPKRLLADVSLYWGEHAPGKKSQDSISVRTEPSTPCVSLGTRHFNFVPRQESSALPVKEAEVVLHRATDAGSTLLPVLLKSVVEGEGKLLDQWKSMMKCDKYLRLLCAFLKTYRAYRPKTHLNKVYKQLILARRVIRWEGKYDTLIDIFSQKGENMMKLFKAFQVVGDVIDLTAFWVKTCSTGSNNERIIDRLEQIESNFYFAQCVIWTGIYGYRYLKLRREAGSDEKKLAEAKNKLFENGIKCIKYIMDVLTSYNNSSLKAHCGQINLKIAGMLTVLSSLIGVFLLWR